jgi:hypothetical protein
VKIVLHIFSGRDVRKFSSCLDRLKSATYLFPATKVAEVIR